MSKQIQRYMDKHPEKFDSWHNEDHNERGLDYWVYTTSDHICPESECGTIHEDTVAETLAKMRTVRKMNTYELNREAEQYARWRAGAEEAKKKRLEDEKNNPRPPAKPRVFPKLKL